MPKRRLDNDCVTKISHTRVALRGEHARSAVFLNAQRKVYRAIRMDGCLLMSTLSADWLLSLANVGDLVVEFKGVDVGHALLQVIATLRFWKTHQLRVGTSRLSGLIVCAAQRPAVSPQIQRARREMRAQFGADLVISTGNREYLFKSFFR